MAELAITLRRKDLENLGRAEGDTVNSVLHNGRIYREGDTMRFADEIEMQRMQAFLRREVVSMGPSERAQKEQELDESFKERVEEQKVRRSQRKPAAKEHSAAKAQKEKPS